MAGDFMTNDDLKNLIISEKAARDTVILAHTYQAPDIIDIADFSGDSYALAKAAVKYSSKRIIVCGVRFMGETVKILAPEKTVLLPKGNATCPMAEQIPPERIAQYKKEHPKTVVICYINTTAELKAQCDVCVTSSSAETIVRALPQEDFLFIPDKNLGGYIANKIPEKHFELMEGFCPVHNSVTADDVKRLKRLHPDAKLAVHPECRAEVTKLADFVGSTSAIIEYSLKSDDEIILGTERGVYDYLSIKHPERKFYQLAPDKLVCKDMKMTILNDVYNTLIGQSGEELTMNEDLRIAAKVSIDNMLKYGG